MTALPATLPGYDTAMMAARGAPEAKAPGKTAESAKEFEAMFLSEMLNHMFSGLEVDPMFGGGHGEEMFRSMMVQEYGRIMAGGRNGIGIADEVQKMMLQMQQDTTGGEKP